MPLQESVRALLKQAGLLESSAAAKIIVGVSGGPDSLALLHALSQICPPPSLVVAHLHHGLRPEAGADARLVAETAAAWNIACHVERVDVAALARQQGWTLEEAGRKARYHFFARLAAQVGAGAVAVAHNADDQAETVLMHLLRGSGLTGLRGMRPLGHVPDAPGLILLRPLLDISRAEIEAYCRQHNLRPHEDHSNLDPSFLRNRLRHELLPLLAGYNPQIKSHLQHLATVVAADDELLDTLLQQQWPDVIEESATEWLILDRQSWLALPLSLRRRSLRRAIAQLRPSLADLGFRPLEQARLIAETGDVGAQASLPGGLVLSVGYNRLAIKRGAAALPATAPQLPGPAAIELPIPGRVELANNWIIEATEINAIDLEQVEANQDPWLAFIDPGDAQALHIRPRRPGERIQPLGMGGHSAKVKDLMINHKIDARLRPLWPLIASAGHPIWLIGHHIDQRARVTATSRRVIQLHCRQNQPLHM
jgi:tRNA(Ile)-lysidine synthase